MNPKVYVGTYAKYNRCSIAGGWISLKSCKNYDDFLKKCQALHSDEREPELMVQDTDDFPDGLSCGESFGEEEFNDVMAAIKSEEAAEKKPSGDKALLPEFRREMAKAWRDEHMLDYECKQFSYGVRLSNGGILRYEKPSIENRFCWADEGPSLDAYNRVTSSEERLKQYFLRENLAQFDEDIEKLQSLTHDGKTLYLYRESYFGETSPMNLWEWKFWDEWDVQVNPSKYPGEHVKMTEPDRKVILAGVKHEREKFEKRLNAYLKRYGTKKIKTWTYWADA